MLDIGHRGEFDSIANNVNQTQGQKPTPVSVGVLFVIELFLLLYPLPTFSVDEIHLSRKYCATFG